MSRQPVLSTPALTERLRAVDLFEMLSDADLERVLSAGQKRRLAQGEYLFKAGDPPDSVHVVLDGAIEVVRSTPDDPEPIPVAYISPGEAIGDMALFTGNLRRSAGRAPEFAEILTLSRAAFEELTRTIDGYGLQLAGVFARRLAGFIQQMRGQRRKKELSGKLKFFDLPTVVQTLMSSKQTGVLTITDDDGRTYAQVLLRDGTVERARRGLLDGEEAFMEIFHNLDSGEFFFRTVREPNADDVSNVAIAMSGMHLLMESTRLLDEFPAVRRRLPDPDKPYQARTGTLRWKEAATQAIAEEVFTTLRDPRPIADLIDEIACSTYTLYRIAADLYETGQIA